MCIRDRSIVVTPNAIGGEVLNWVIDFDDSPNPTEFSVYIYNGSGSQVERDFRWIARGRIAPPL